MTLIILLLAAILITLLGVWGRVPGCLLAIIGAVIWAVLVGETGKYVGQIWALVIWTVGLFIVIVIVATIMDEVRLHRDKKREDG